MSRTRDYVPRTKKIRDYIIDHPYKQYHISVIADAIGCEKYEVKNSINQLMPDYPGLTRPQYGYVIYTPDPAPSIEPLGQAEILMSIDINLTRLAIVLEKIAIDGIVLR